MNKKINIFGGGIAGLSLAKQLNNIEGLETNLFTLNNNKKDHFIAFWKADSMKDAYSIKVKSWKKWKIVTNQNEKIFTAFKHDYCVVKKNKWIDLCYKKILKNKNTYIKNEKIDNINSNFFKTHNLGDKDLIFDSRPVQYPKNILLQHFYGKIVKTERDTFDDEVVTLMDFRCDQKMGIHFIYLLPLTKKMALVESTLLSQNTENKKFYSLSIKDYLERFYNLKKFSVINTEKGIIPMHQLNCKNKQTIGIGIRGGAARPSTGYAFHFIQNQTNKLANQIKFNKKISNDIHSRFNLFMDRVFLRVLKVNKSLAPEIFYKFSLPLSGDEMARFMIGEATIKLWFRIVYSLPKIIFIKSLIFVIFNVK